MSETSTPDWVEHVMWWHVYPLGLLGADTTGSDRAARRTLADLEPWLDDVVALGLNGILLAPIFESETHGYDTVDYFRIDSRLGTDHDFARLIEAARVRGIRVLLDGVFNHVSRGFADVDLLRRTDSGEVATFEGHDALVALNHSDPRVVDLVVGVMSFWLDRGIDGWRLDAAYAVPSSFWAAVLPRVRVAHPGAYFLGEYLHGDYAEVVREGTLDSVTQYELWQAIWHSIQTQNFFELDWALTRHNAFLEHFLPYTFIGNHDVTRIASQIADERNAAHALVLLLTLGGTPAIYYGDERGQRAVKEERVGGDDAIRPAYPDDPGQLDENDVYRLHQELIGLRRRHPWLVRATSTAVALTNTHYVIEVRAGSSRLFVALNLGDEPVACEVDAHSVLAGRATGGRGGWRLDGHGWAILE